MTIKTCLSFLLLRSGNLRYICSLLVWEMSKLTLKQQNLNCKPEKSKIFAGICWIVIFELLSRGSFIQSCIALSEACLRRSGLYCIVIPLAWKLASSHAVEGDSGQEEPCWIPSSWNCTYRSCLTFLVAPAEQEGRGFWFGHSNW